MELRRPGRTVTVLVAAGLVVAGAGTAVVLLRSGNGSGDGSGVRGAADPSGGPAVPLPTPSAGTDGGTRAPSRPPVAVCASPPDGPASPPDGAVVVRVGESLSAVVGAHPRTTSYWLEPGVHRLGPGEYDQVVPHDGDSFVGAPGAVLDGGRVNRYAFGGPGRDVTIAFLTVQNFGPEAGNRDEGVVNHDSSPGWTLRDSVLQRNAGAGIMVGSRGRVLRNCLRDNGQYGFNAYAEGGVSDVVLEGNEISGNDTDGWERRVEGCGCTGGGKFWATRGARVVGNWVHDNRGAGLWADTNNTDFLFRGNYVADNDAEGLLYETSYNAAVLANTFVRNALVTGPANPGFPTPALYLSESGSDPRVGGRYGEAFVVAGNVFRDNWSGVVAWENADRFAGSPANTSSGASPLVNPRSATVAACSTPEKIRKAPYYDDCRWKTQRVVVERNTFSLDRAAVPGCRPSQGCGFNGVFSNYGSYPDWSPYQGTVVQRDITFEQGNVFRRNTYRGPWRFMVEEQGNSVSWSSWRSAPYRQDAGSRLLS